MQDKAGCSTMIHTSVHHLLFIIKHDVRQCLGLLLIGTAITVIVWHLKQPVENASTLCLPFTLTGPVSPGLWMPNHEETYATLPAAAWFRHRLLSFIQQRLLAVLQELLLLPS
jgi:hypothetical protein